MSAAGVVSSGGAQGAALNLWEVLLTGVAVGVATVLAGIVLAYWKRWWRWVCVGTYRNDDSSYQLRTRWYVPKRWDRMWATFHTGDPATQAISRLGGDLRRQQQFAQRPHCPHCCPSTRQQRRIGQPPDWWTRRHMDNKR